MILNRVQYDFAHKRKLYTLEIVEKIGKLTCHDDQVYWNFTIPQPNVSKTRLTRMIQIVTSK